MFVDNLKFIKKIPMNIPGALNVVKQVPIGNAEGWEDHAMRVFTISDMGNTPKHSHEWPHINYIIKGEGILHMNGTDHPVEEGSVSYVPKGVEHQFKSTTKGEFSFICIVPNVGEY
ncbi:MAG: cupin [Denitrovibrio sp.]|nr:MAG: cupin [Denitrovibrio sp.]